MFKTARSIRELVVLIDFEGGDHPWLSGFLRIVDFWQRHGLRLVLVRFDRRPERLTLLPSRRLLSLRDLARVHDRAVLLIFSRQLSVLRTCKTACWTSVLEAWPLRAWLDPDPRPLSERHYEQQRDIEYLEQCGLLRFPYTESGLLLLARYFAADGIGISPPQWEPVPDLGSPELRAAIKSWAAVSALVPDASWDQLDVFRRAFLAKELSDFRYVQRLIEFVSQRIGSSAECGAVLLIPADEEDRLLRGLRGDADPSKAPDCLEAQARKLLLKQLGKTIPGQGGNLSSETPGGVADSLAGWIWLLKTSGHLAVLEPQRALDYYLPLLGSPVDAEARQMINQGLQLHSSRLPRLERLLGHRSDIMLRELWTGQPTLWPRACFVALPLMVLTLLLAGSLPYLVIRSRWIGQKPRASLPSVLIVRERESR